MPLPLPLGITPKAQSEEQENILRPLPKELKFSIPIGNESIFYIITSEEFELMDAFEKLGSHGEKVHIEFDAQMPRQNMKIRVYNDKESVDLEKIEIKKSLNYKHHNGKLDFTPRLTLITQRRRRYYYEG